MTRVASPRSLWQSPHQPILPDIRSRVTSKENGEGENRRQPAQTIDVAIASCRTRSIHLILELRPNWRRKNPRPKIAKQPLRAV